MSPKTHAPRPSDETLMAYADGLLDAEEARAVERHLEADAEAREIVEAFRRSATVAAGAYDDVLAAPVPDRLVKAVLGTEEKSGPDGRAGGDQGAAVPQRSDNVVAFPPRPPRRPLALAYLAPLAASVLLAVGAVAGYRLATPSVSGDAGALVAIGPVPGASALAGLLEKRISNDPVTVAGPGKGPAAEIMVVATFVDRNGRYCREFEATVPAQPGDTASGPMTAAVACRNPGGTWSIEGAVHIAGGSGPSLGDFNPASGKSYSAVESLLTALGAKPALAADDEKRALEGGWRTGG